MEQADVLDPFNIDFDAGKMFWEKPSKYHIEKMGQEAGGPTITHNKKYYWTVRIGGRKYKRGRLLFLAAYGTWPEPCIDHINGNSLDDSLSNLREATFLQNSWNHKGRKRRIDLPMGVLLCASGRFGARITCRGKQIHLGTYITPDEASTVYQSKRRELYGKFA